MVAPTLNVKQYRMRKYFFELILPGFFILMIAYLAVELTSSRLELNHLRGDYTGHAMSAYDIGFGQGWHRCKHPGAW